MPEPASQRQGEPNVTTRQGNWQQWDSNESVSAFLLRRGGVGREGLTASSPSPQGEDRGGRNAGRGLSLSRC